MIKKKLCIGTSAISHRVTITFCELQVLLQPYKKRSYRKHTENIRKHTKNIQKMCAIQKLYRNCTENIYSEIRVTHDASKINYYFKL